MSHSGWSNEQLTSLTLPEGATSGQRITINNDQDGAILVYDAGNNLIASMSALTGTADDGTAYTTGVDVFKSGTAAEQITIGADGDGSILAYDGSGKLITSLAVASGTAADGTAYLEGITVYYPANGYSILLDPTTGSLQIARGTSSGAPAQIIPQITGGGSSILRVQSGTPAGISATQTTIAMHSQDAGGGPARLVATQDTPAGTGLSGCLLQNDDSAGTAAKNLHMATYPATTDASGNVTLTHHCAFTPTGGVLASAGATVFYQYAFFSGSFNATTVRAHFNDNTGANLANQTISILGLFWG